MYVIYHSRDLDGQMSAAIVLKHAKENKYHTTIDFIGWDYGDPIPKLEKGRRIVMCDIAFPIEEMYKLCDLSEGSFVWIDHHASAIKEMLDNDGPAYCKAVIPKVKTIRGRNKDSLMIEKKGACELTWEYFYPVSKMPLIVRYLGSYDSFRHKSEKNEHDILHFQYAARAYLTDYKECYNIFEYFEVFEGNYERWIERGKVIKLYLNVEAKDIFKTAVDIKIDGYNFKAINRQRFNPNNFDLNYKEEGVMSYYYKGSGKWEVSLYSDGVYAVDVSVLAKKRNGGGHTGAAGFITDNIEQYLNSE